MSLNEQSTVTLTMSQIYKILGALGAIVLLAVTGIWAVAHFTFGGINESVKSLRTDVATISQAIAALDRGGLNELRTAEIRLTQQMGALREQIGSFTGKVEVVEKSFAGLAIQMSDIQKNLVQRVEFNPGPVVDTLKKYGFTDQQIIVVPYGPTAPR